MTDDESMGGITLLKIAARGDSATAVRAILECGGGGKLLDWAVTACDSLHHVS